MVLQIPHMITGLHSVAQNAAPSSPLGPGPHEYTKGAGAQEDKQRKQWALTSPSPDWLMSSLEWSAFFGLRMHSGLAGAEPSLLSYGQKSLEQRR